MGDKLYRALLMFAFLSATLALSVKFWEWLH